MVKVGRILDQRQSRPSARCPSPTPTFGRPFLVARGKWMDGWVNEEQRKAKKNPHATTGGVFRLPPRNADPPLSDISVWLWHGMAGHWALGGTLQQRQG